MKIVVAQSPASPEIITANDGHEFLNVSAARFFLEYADADAYIDVGFDGSFFSPVDKPLLINETTSTISELKPPHNNVARFCGWQTFMGRDVWEIASANAEQGWIADLMKAIGKQFELVADEPGFVAPRILSMIVNEACFALGEGISTPEAIDKAMTLGTNYPRGPIAWAQMIGTEKIHALLSKLSKTDSRYLPHEGLKNNFAECL